MPRPERGEIENPTKSAFSLEYYDSSWEYEYMKELESDKNVAKWTKNHGISIPYFDDEGRFHTYRPDFLVQLSSGKVELHEMKGGHLLENPITRKKLEAAREWCRVRKMELRVVSRY